MSEIPYMMANTQAEFERVRDLAWPRTPAPDLSPAEAARVAAFDAAPEPAEVVEYREKVERVARALRKVMETEHPADGISADEWLRRLAAAAIAALPPTPAEEAVKRVEALAEALDREAETAERVSFSTVSANRRAAASRIRAALASPAPAPQGEAPTCYCGRLGHRLGGPILHKRTEECPR